MPKKTAPKDKKNVPPKMQTIIVPKGTIDPTDDTVIEIPAGLHTKPIVVAKRKDGRLINRSALFSSDQNKSYVDNATLPLNYTSNRDKTFNVLNSSKLSQVPDLDEAEDVEKEVVLKQLEEFQKARRKFLVDTTAVATTSTTAAMPELGRTRSSSPFLERSARWDDHATQTIPPPIPPRPKRLRDSLTVAREHMNKSSTSLRKARSGEYGEKKVTVGGCSSDCKNLLDNKISLEDLDELEEESEENEPYEFDGFAPGLNSTFTVRRGRKEETGSGTSSGKTSLEKLPRSHRGDKYFKPKAKKETMEKKTSRTSERSLNISITESCLSTDCPHGSIKKDDSCAPCCTAKFSGKSYNKRSRSTLPEEDFEKIKEQLREARKKLDEAVAMVSRTVASSSSCYAASKMTPETDLTPRSSRMVEVISKSSSTSNRPPSEKSYSRKTSVHDPQKCPLSNITDIPSDLTRPRTSKSKSTTDNLLCLDMCSNLELPPCVSKDSLKPKSAERRKSSSSVVPCVLTFPCDIPSATSGRYSIGPPSTSTKSLPIPSSRTEESRPRSSSKAKYVDEEYLKLKEENQKRRSVKLKTLPNNEDTQPKEEEGKRRSSTGYKLAEEEREDNSRQSRPRSSSRSKSITEDDYPRPTSTDESRQRSSSKTKSNREDEYPRIKDDEIRSKSSKSKYVNEDDYPRVSEDESRPRSSRSKSSTRSRSGEEVEYPRVKESPSRKSNTACSMGTSKSRDSNVLCSNMCLNMDAPPCTSEDLMRKKTEQLARTLRKLSDNLNSSMGFPCVPILPCELPPAQSRQEVIRPRSPSLSHSALASTKIPESQQRKNEPSPKIKEDSSYLRFSDNINKKPTRGVCKASQTRGSDVDLLCSRVCLNMDPPPCQSEKEPSKNTVTPQSSTAPPPPIPSPSGVVCAATYPCERVPSATPTSATPTESVPRSTKSLPTSSSNIPETEKVVIQPTPSLTTKEEVKEPPKPATKEKASKEKAPKEKPPKKGKNKQKQEEKKTSSKEENQEQGQEQGGKILINTTTQTHTEKTVTLFKSNMESEEILEDEQVTNALMNSLDVDEKITKNTTVKFKKNKK